MEDTRGKERGWFLTGAIEGIATAQAYQNQKFPFLSLQSDKLEKVSIIS